MKAFLKKIRLYFKISPAKAEAENFTVTKPVSIKGRVITGKLYCKVPGLAKPLKLPAKSYTMAVNSNNK